MILLVPSSNDGYTCFFFLFDMEMPQKVGVVLFA